MSAGNRIISFVISLIIGIAGNALSAESANKLVSQGNELYRAGDFNEAIINYDKALEIAPNAVEPKFNKANSFYRLDDLSQAMELYRQTAAESKNMPLVTKSKYNLGNSHFQSGKKQAQSDTQKAIDQLKTAIVYWRGVLDIEPENDKAAKNIEVAKLTIKELLEQQKNQQDPNQCRDPNQAQDPNQSEQQNQQQSPSDSNEPNQPQQQQQDSGSDPNESQDQQQQEQQEQETSKQQEQEAPDTTAQAILEKEQKQREERQEMQRLRFEKVEMDW